MHKVFKGALAGLAGGIAGLAAKAYAERLFPSSIEGQVPTPLVTVERTVDSPLSPGEKELALQGIPWAFGGLIGAAYGVIVEYSPKASAANGIAFGLLLNRLTHQGVLPVDGLSAAVSNQSDQENQNEQITHAIYGVVTEFVRSQVRRRL